MEGIIGPVGVSHCVSYSWWLAYLMNIEGINYHLVSSWIGLIWEKNKNLTSVLGVVKLGWLCACY